MEAAYHVYYRFWGNEIDESLRLVPDSKFKYLPKELIDSLLVKHLRYGEDVLLVREEYKVAYRELQLLENPEDALEPRSGGVVVTGQPELVRTSCRPPSSLLTIHPIQSRKSCFLYFILFLLLVHGRQSHFKLAITFCFFKIPTFR